MKRMIPTILASTALFTAAPALAESHSGGDMAGGCGNFEPGDINRDAGLSQEEIETLRDTEFSKLDADGDGIVSRGEWAECEAQKQAAMTGDGEGKFEVGTWSDLNLEPNDKLSGEQWAARAEEAWNADQGKAQQVFSGADKAESAEQFAAAAVERFRSHDQNGDGVLTKSEYESTPRGRDDADLDARFDQLDADDTGGISPQEYRAAATWMARPGPALSGTEAQQAEAASVKRFQRNDSDGDGSLSREEFANSERGAQWSDEELTARFEQLDKDGTGGISPQEYRPAATWMSGDAALETNEEQGTAADETAPEGTDSGVAIVPVFYYYVEML